MSRPHPSLIALAADRPPLSVAKDPYLLESAVEHKMTGLLWRSISNGATRVDTQTMRTLAALSLQTETRHQHLWQVLANVMQRLLNIGVDVATVKGITAEERWYDGVGDRPCVDIDLLVGPDDLGRTDDIVAALMPEHPLCGQAAELVAGEYLAALPLVVGGVGVDLHFDLFKLGYSPSLTAAMWERTRALIREDGSRFRVLDPESALVHFLVHLNKDRFARLLGYADIARILAREDLDWEHIDRLVRVDGMDTVVYEALDAVTEGLGIDRVDHPPTTGWRRRLWRILWRPDTRLLGSEGMARFRRRGHMVLPLLLRGRSGAAMKRLLRRFAPPRPLLDFNYPRSSGPYLVRVFKDRVDGARSRRRDGRRFRERWKRKYHS